MTINALHISEMTVQIRVTDIETGQAFYEKLLRRPPDFIPHEGFIEWEILPKCWLQVGVGEPAQGSGPLRFGVDDIEAERHRVMNDLGVQVGAIDEREEVPVKWCTFVDPWGNRIGFFQEK